MRTKIAFFSALLVASTAFAGPWDDVVKWGYAVSGGPLTGAMGFAVCEQVDDDTTPSIGTPPASFPSGCNVLLTSTNHSGGISITRFDDAESGTEPVTSTLYEQILWVVGRAATNQTTIADGANFRLKEISWDSPATGDHSVIQFKATYLTGPIASIADGGGGTSLDITATAHGLVTGQTVTLLSMSVVAYDGTYVINSVADPNTFNVTQTYSATATGTFDAVRFDEMWRSGNVDDYLYQNLYVSEGNSTDFPEAQVVVGQANTGKSDANNIGLVGEANAAGALSGTGLLGVGKGTGALNSYGVRGVGHITVTGDTTTAVGVSGESKDVHAGGSNVALWADAQLGAANYALYIAAGHFFNTARMDWTIFDNSATSHTISSTGASSIFNIGTLDGEETVSHTSKFTGSSALDAGSGDEYAWDLSYTTDKLTSGDDYGLRIRQTDTASPATSYLLDIGVGASSQFYVTNTGLMTLYGSSWTDSMQWYHDESDAYHKWDDGNLILQTAEGTNTATAIEFKPKGTSEVSSLGLYDTDTRELWLHTDANRGYLDSGSGALGLQSNVVQDILLWEAIGSGNPSLVLSGWNTAGVDLESTELTMDDTNDEFLIRAANSVNHEGITVELDEANQLFRVRGSDGAVDFSSSDTALLAVNPATFNSTIDAESYMALGNGSALASNKTLIIDRDFNDASDGEALSVVGSQIEVTAGTGDIHHTMMHPGATTFSTAATVHGYATTLNLLEPNIVLADGATVTHAATLRIAGAPTEGATSNWALWVDGDDVKFDGALTVDGLTTLGGGLTMGADLDMAGWDILNLDDAYSTVLVADTLPRSTMILPQHPWSQAPTPANYVGSNLLLSGSTGAKSVAIVAALSGGNTIVITHNASQIGAASTVTTYTSDAGGWVCSTETDADCTLNLLNIILGAPVSGWTASCADGTCSTATIYFQPDAETWYLLLAETGTTFTKTLRNDGQILVSPGSSTLAGIASALDPSTGIRLMPNQVVFQAGGATRGWVSTTQLFVNSIDLVMKTANRVYANDGPINFGTDYGGAGTPATGSAVFGEDTSNVSAWFEGKTHFEDDIEAYTSTIGANTFQNTLAGATATFGSITAAGAASGAADWRTGAVTGAGDFDSGNWSGGSGTSSDTAGNSGSVTLDSGAGIDDSGTATFGSGVATNGTAGDTILKTDGVTRVTIDGDSGATDVDAALTASSVASDAFVTGTYGTFTLGAAEKFYINAATTEHTQTAGVLDIDLVPTTAATGVVAADIHITAPDAGIEATTHVGLNIQYTGDAQDEGASIVQLIQVGFQPNTSGTTVYGMYSGDNDLDYFIFNDGTAPSRFDGETIFANNPATATFGLSTTDADVVLTFDALGATQGTLTWMEDEDRFDFDNDVDVIGDLTAGTVAVVSTKGAATTTTLNVESVTFPGGGGAASQVTVGSLIPDGAIFDGISTYVTTADNAGACTGYTVGDGVDPDLYGVAATETQGTTTTPASGTASTSNPQFGGPYEVTITGTGGNCIDMVVRITAHYRLVTADTTL